MVNAMLCNIPSPLDQRAARYQGGEKIGSAGAFAGASWNKSIFWGITPFPNPTGELSAPSLQEGVDAT